MRYQASSRELIGIATTINADNRAVLLIRYKH